MPSLSRFFSYVWMSSCINMTYLLIRHLHILHSVVLVPLQKKEQKTKPVDCFYVALFQGCSVRFGLLILLLSLFYGLHFCSFTLSLDISLPIICKDKLQRYWLVLLQLWDSDSVEPAGKGPAPKPDNRSLNPETWVNWTLFACVTYPGFLMESCIHFCWPVCLQNFILFICALPVRNSVLLPHSLDPVHI